MNEIDSLLYREKKSKNAKQSLWALLIDSGIGKSQGKEVTAFERAEPSEIRNFLPRKIH